MCESSLSRWIDGNGAWLSAREGVERVVGCWCCIRAWSMISESRTPLLLLNVNLSVTNHPRG